MHLRTIVIIIIGSCIVIALAGCADSARSEQSARGGQSVSDEPRVDTSSFEAFHQSLRVMSDSLEGDQQRALSEAIPVIMLGTRPAASASPGSNEEGFRETMKHLEGMTAAELIAFAATDQPMQQRAQELQDDAKRSALRGGLQTIRAMIAHYRKDHDEWYPDLTPEWEPLVGRYLRSAPNNPFALERDDPSALGVDIEAIGPDIAWLYDAETGEIRAVIAHDVAVAAGLVPRDSTPGATTRDVVTY